MSSVAGKIARATFFCGNGMFDDGAHDDHGYAATAHNRLRDANAFARTIEALHRVPGVLFTETGVGIRRALVAHDGAVALAALIGAAKGAGATVKVVVTATATSPASHVPVSRNVSWVLYAALLLSTTCILRATHFDRERLQWIAPIFLLVMLVESVVRKTFAR